MSDVLYVVLTLVAFALLAVLVGALGRWLDEPDGPPASAVPADEPETAAR